jgi:hypothetical protein
MLELRMGLDKAPNHVELTIEQALIYWLDGISKFQILVFHFSVVKTGPLSAHLSSVETK